MRDLIADVISVLSTSAARWTALASIEPELLARPPEPGEWSAIQCLRHMVDTDEGVFRARVHAILAGRDFAAYDPDREVAGDAAPSAVELAARLEQMRPASLGVLRTLTEADLDRTARHAALGMVTMRELLYTWAAHDTMHIVQAERALMQAFILGSGPWRSYFADHDVEARPAAR